MISISSPRLPVRSVLQARTFPAAAPNTSQTESFKAVTTDPAPSPAQGLLHRLALPTTVTGLTAGAIGAGMGYYGGIAGAVAGAAMCAGGAVGGAAMGGAIGVMVGNQLFGHASVLAKIGTGVLVAGGVALGALGGFYGGASLGALIASHGGTAGAVVGGLGMAPMGAAFGALGALVDETESAPAQA